MADDHNSALLDNKVSPAHGFEVVVSGVHSAVQPVALCSLAQWTGM